MPLRDGSRLKTPEADLRGDTSKKGPREAGLSMTGDQFNRDQAVLV
jgi:hypothetical protein